MPFHAIFGRLARQERERGFQQQIEELRTDNADGYNKCKIALEKGIQERRASEHPVCLKRSW